MSDETYGAVLYDFESLDNERLSELVTRPSAATGVHQGVYAKVEVYTASGKDEDKVAGGSKALKLTQDTAEQAAWPPVGVQFRLNPGIMRQLSSIVFHLRVTDPGDRDGGMFFRFVTSDGSVFDPQVEYFDDISNRWIVRPQEPGNKLNYALSARGFKPTWFRLSLDSSATRVSGSSVTFNKNNIAGLVIAGQSGVLGTKTALYIDEIYGINWLERYYTDQDNVNFNVSDPAEVMLPATLITDPASGVAEHPEYSEYLNGNRYFDIAGHVARDEKTGRLWSLMVSGGITEGAGMVNLLFASDDDGKTWGEPKFLLKGPTENVSAADEVLWMDPDGRMWWFYCQSYDCSRYGVGQASATDGRGGVWAMYTDNPGDETPAWSSPVRFFDGMMNTKPTVLERDAGDLKAGTWLVNVSYPAQKDFGVPYNYSTVYASSDKGKTWVYRGGIKENIGGIENMIVQRSDGSLLMGLRSAGINYSESSDGGKTWTPRHAPENLINKVGSRFYLGRLDSGTLLLVYNAGGPSGRETERFNMTAALSYDDGVTWPKKLLLDDRYTSYPDAHIASDGTIYITYDNGRDQNGVIYMAKITKEDIEAGKLVSPGSELKMAVADNTVAGNPPTVVKKLYDFESTTDADLKDLISTPPAGYPYGGVDHSINVTPSIYCPSAADSFLGAGKKALKLTASAAKDWPMPAFVLKLDGASLMDASSVVLHIAAPGAEGDRGMLLDFLMEDGSVYTVCDTPWGSGGAWEKPFGGDPFTTSSMNITKWNGDTGVWDNITCGNPITPNYVKYLSPSAGGAWYKIPLLDFKMIKLGGPSTHFDKTKIVGLLIGGQSRILNDSNALYIDEVYAVTKDNKTAVFTDNPGGSVDPEPSAPDVEDPFVPGGGSPATGFPVFPLVLGVAGMLIAACGLILLTRKRRTEPFAEKGGK